MMIFIMEFSIITPCFHMLTPFKPILSVWVSGCRLIEAIDNICMKNVSEFVKTFTISHSHFSFLSSKANFLHRQKHPVKSFLQLATLSGVQLAALSRIKHWIFLLLLQLLWNNYLYKYFLMTAFTLRKLG